MTNIFPGNFVEKVTPADNDKILLADSTDLDKIKYGKFSNFKGADSTVPWPAGTNWLNGVDWNGIASITTNKVGKTTTVTITEGDATVTSFNVEDWADGLGGGDMTKVVYDPTNKNQDIFAYADSLVAGLLDFRGWYDASVNTFPAAGWSGTAGAILKWDTWAISVAGTLWGVAIQVWDVILATVDTPGQTTGNWTKLNTNVSYVPEDVANKETTALDTSTTKYPCNNVVKVAVDGKLSTTSKATGAEVDTGTDDAKFVTAKAMEDSSYGKNPMTTAWDVIYGGTSWVPTRLAKWTDWQVLTLASGIPTWAAWGGGSTWGSYMFAIAWTIGATGTNVANTVLVNGTKTITSVDLWYGTAGSGTLTVDVNKNGITLFATTKPSIITTNQWSVASGTLTTTALASGDYLTIDIDAVPWTTLPVDLYVRVNYS